VDTDTTAATLLCDTAMTEVHCGQRKELFASMQRGSDMYFVISGNMEYLSRRGNYREEFGEGTWFCEIVLWVDWDLQGTMSAQVPSELAAFSSRSFREIAKQFSCFNLLKAYAHLFARAIIGTFGLTGVNEVWHDVCKVREMVEAAWTATSEMHIRATDSTEAPDAVRFTRQEMSNLSLTSATDIRLDNLIGAVARTSKFTADGRRSSLDT